MQKRNIFKLVSFIIISYFIFLGGVSASSLSLSKSSGNVSVGSTVKITAKISGGTSYTYSNFSISYDQDRFTFVSSGDNCNGLNCLIEGNGSVTLTFKAKSQGSGTFSASGSFEDDSSGSLSASTSVTVGEKVESKTLNNNNNLASLSVEGYSLTPKFGKDVLEYTLDLKANVTEINVVASPEDKTAKVTGAGTIKVSEGINTINVEVTAENGSKKTYVIKATVAEKNPIQEEIDGKKYTIVKNIDSLTKPENYEAKTIKINNQEVPAFYSDLTKLTLIGLKDNQGNIKLYIYDEKTGDMELYQEINTSGVKFYPRKLVENDGYDFKNYHKYTVDINGIKVETYKLTKDSKYAIVYGMDVETGEENYYVYDLKNNTLQVYDEELATFYSQKDQLYSIIILASWGTIFLFLLIIIVLAIKSSKRKKKIRTILEKIGGAPLDDSTENQEDIVDEEQIVDEVMENKEEDEMYDIFEDDKKRK